MRAAVRDLGGAQFWEINGVNGPSPLECREIGGHTGPVVEADNDWLLRQKVVQAMGPESLALWVADPEWVGFSARNGAAAAAAGLRHRPRAELLTQTLRWEWEQGLNRPRRAGLSSQRERELLETWGRAVRG